MGDERMKKIMFNERFGLEQAVLDGTKDMTRRVIKGDYVEVAHLEHEGSFIGKTANGESVILPQPAYNVGEEVWIAQSYKNLGYKPDAWIENTEGGYQQAHEFAGYTNKMFVRSIYLTHRIRITATKLERLQDISDEDCLREGVFKYDNPPLYHEADMFAPWAPYVRPYKWDSNNLVYRCTARYAFAYLIDKISGAGTWNRNPWVYVYTFELLR